MTKGDRAHGPTTCRPVRPCPAARSGTRQVRHSRRPRHHHRPGRRGGAAQRLSRGTACVQGALHHRRDYLHLPRQPVLDLQAPGQPAGTPRGAAVRRAERGRPGPRRAGDRGHYLRARPQGPARLQRGQLHRHRPRHRLPLVRVPQMGLPRPRAAAAPAAPGSVRGGRWGRQGRRPGLPALRALGAGSGVPGPGLLRTAGRAPPSGATAQSKPGHSERARSGSPAHRPCPGGLFRPPGPRRTRPGRSRPGSSAPSAPRAPGRHRKR